jgi:hypothetical protein
MSSASDRESEKFKRLQYLISLQNYQEEDARAIAAWFVDTCSGDNTPQSSSGIFNLVIGKHAIRTADVDLFESVARALPAAVGILIPGTNIATPIAALFATVFLFFRNLSTKGVGLNARSIRILTVLKANVRSHEEPGMLVEEILAILQRTEPEWDLPTVEQTLSYLTKHPNRGGGYTELVSQAASRWRPHA